MTGIATFLYALLDYLQDRVGSISVSFDSEAGAPGSPEHRRSRVERSRMKTAA